MFGLFTKKVLGASAAVSVVFGSLFITEGVGDNVTDIPTGALGVTPIAKEEVDGRFWHSDEAIARKYLKQLGKYWEAIPGFSKAPWQVQAMLLDLSYNIGPSAMALPKLTRALMEEDYAEVARQTLDTASVDGRALRGLAVRRAKFYNKIMKDDIKSVEQMEDGTLIYRNVNWEVLFSYKPRGGRHAKSVVGVIAVPDSM